MDPITLYTSAIQLFSMAAASTPVRGASTAANSRSQRAAAARLLRTVDSMADMPAAPAPAIRKGGSEPSRPRAAVTRASADTATVASTIARYAAEGWSTLVVPTATLMDFIAVRGERMHFVKVIAADAAEPSVGWRNQYIQNAMSNSAEPIFAAAADGTLTNINEGRRVVIAKRGTASTTAASAAAQPL